MLHKYHDELTLLAEQTQALKEAAAALPPELGAVRIKVTNHANLSLNFINGLLGAGRLRPGQPSGTDQPLERKPVTHIFGEEIKMVNANQPVKAVDTEPQHMEREKFISEVEDWYKNAPNLPVEKIFNKATQPGGETVIRAVAKKAGIEDYADAEITVAFAEGLQVAITKLNSAQVELEEAKKKVTTSKK